jgi:hypothetical protein
MLRIILSLLPPHSHDKVFRPLDGAEKEKKARRPGRAFFELRTAAKPVVIRDYPSRKKDPVQGCGDSTDRASKLPRRTGASCAGPEWPASKRSTPRMRDQSRPPTPKRVASGILLLQVLGIHAGLRRPPPGAQHPCLRLDDGGRDRSHG